MSTEPDKKPSPTAEPKGSSASSASELPRIAPLPSIAPAIAKVTAPPPVVKAALPSIAPAMPQAIRQPPSPPPGSSLDTREFEAELALKVMGLDSADYFEVLGVGTAASTAEIKRAFHQMSRLYHPDRFFQETDAELKRHVGTLYKRMTEAYYVLKDDVRRQKYAVDIGGAERAKKLRYTEATEAELKAEVQKKSEEVYGSNPKARQFYKTALADIEKENWQNAERNLKSALTFEMSNANFKGKLLEVQAKLEAIRKASSDGFKIK
jgi:DnaJ-domain-containing protein 1